jgi:hypothetical protein
MSSLTRKNPYLNEAIEILDQHLRRCKYDVAVAANTLSHVYSEFVNEELMKCMVDPRYYLENYHVIKTKDEGFKTLNPFFEAQEIIYSEIMELLAAGKPAKVLIDKARQQGSCLDPETPILTDDLRWIAIDEAEPGQGLVSVEEEFRGGRGKGRELRQAHVVARRDVFEPAFRLVMSNGSSLIATGPHRFLSRVRGGVSTIWRTVENMKAGDVIRHIVKPWSDPTVEDGWFGGFTDGEGCLRVKHWGGVEVSVSQRFNEAYERALAYMQSRGYTFRVEVDNRKGGENSKFGNEPVARLVVNRLGEIFRLMGQTRPARFTGKTWWEGKDIPGRTGEGEAWSEIVAIEPLGKKRMVDLQTTTKTYIANGFVSHNSTLAEGLIFQHTIFNEAVNTLIVAQNPAQSDYLFSMSLLAMENLPWWMQPRVRFRSKARYLVLDSDNPEMRGLNSTIYVDAANKLTGVSVGRTIHCAHLSELSDWDNAEILTEQIFPTMSGKNVIAILESTARGADGFWYDFWTEAVESWGEEDWEWKPIFVEWFRCSDYSMPSESKFNRTAEEEKICDKVLRASGYNLTDEQLNWRRIKRKETIKIKGDDTSFLQEYPLTWQESFQASGLCAFPKSLLYEIMNTTCCDPLWYGELEYSHGAAQECKPHLTSTFDEAERARTGNVVYKRDRFIPPAKKYGARMRVWEMPEAGESYYVAGDPAHGLEGGDFSCAQVIRIGHGSEPDVQVCEWNGWINPTPFGHVLVGLAKWYNNAELSVEMNAVGERTYIEIFRILEYPNLFRWKHYDKVKNFWSDYMAWLTTSKTRDLIITNLRERIMEKTVTLYSQELLTQMLHFTADEDGSKFQGQASNDDRVMAMQICLWCAHDSDYGRQAAMAPNTGSEAHKKYYVIDDVNRVVFTSQQKDEAYAAAYVKGEARNIKGEIIPTHAVMRPGWSVAHMPNKKDFNNSDFSPVHDKAGPRAQIHAFGVPAESIRLDNIQEWEMMRESQDRDWMTI